MTTAVVEKVNTPAPPATRHAGLLARIGEKYGVDRELIYKTLKETAFRQRPDRETNQRREPTNEEMVALLALADNYNLDPFKRELYAFYDTKSNAIVAIIPIDGWLRIINEHPALEKYEFTYSDGMEQTAKGKRAFEWIECSITRKDRSAPIVVREYFDEVYRPGKYDDAPWESHPKRMHRHKALIQCARYAFGFGGVVDPDEGERIIEGEVTRVADLPPAIASINAKAQQGAETKGAKRETKPASGETKAPPTPETTNSDRPPLTLDGTATTVMSYAEVRERIDRAKDRDTLDMAEGFIDALPEHFRAELHELAKQRREKLF